MIEYIIRVGNDDVYLICELRRGDEFLRITRIQPVSNKKADLEAALEYLTLAAERHHNGNLPWIAANHGDQWLLRTGEIAINEVRLQKGDMVWL